MTKFAIRTAFAAALFAATAFSQAKNVILFIGDGGGVTSLNAASIYGYGKPQALYVQSMPSVGLADTSTAMEWVTGADAAAGEQEQRNAASISRRENLSDNTNNQRAQQAIMKNSHLLTLTAVTGSLLTLTAQAGIIGSPHDFSGQSWASRNASICLAV